MAQLRERPASANRAGKAECRDERRFAPPVEKILFDIFGIIQIVGKMLPDAGTPSEAARSQTGVRRGCVTLSGVQAADNGTYERSFPGHVLVMRAGRAASLRFRGADSALRCRGQGYFASEKSVDENVNREIQRRR